MTEKPTKAGGWTRVRYGRRVLWARRAETGNWMITNDQATELRTIPSADFSVQYEIVEDDMGDQPV